VQTHLKAEQVTTLRPVTETQVRQETYIEQTPVTTVHNVTVDEGGYQMVWVSKPVTRQVARTTVTQQVKSRQVPVQVMKMIPETTTRMVPYQTVQHVPEIVPVVGPVLTAAPCTTCGHTALWPAPIGLAAELPLLPTITALPATTPLSAHTPTPITAAAPSPADDDGWHTIQPRAATELEEGRPRPVPADAIRPISHQSPRRFTPVPSAAKVWATQR
jgi:hypothetical protein